MKEVESKILNIDKKTTIEKIISFWWKQVSKNEIHWAYYYLWDKKIRIRTEERWNVICYKKCTWNTTDNCKILEETEVVIDNIENFIIIITELWFVKWKEIHKIRTSFDFLWAHLDIDEYNWINPLLEIEASSFEDIVGIAYLLWFERSQLSSISYSEANL